MKTDGRELNNGRNGHVDREREEIQTEKNEREESVSGEFGDRMEQK